MIFKEPDNYQPNCAKLFDEYQIIVRRILPKARVEHIGSSAIEGAISKGDLDILVAVDRDEHSLSVGILEDSGFTIKQDTLRTKELCMMDACRNDIALQVVASGSEIERSFIEFRQALSNSVDLRNEYNDLKRSSISLDMDEYRQRKSEFIQNILHDKQI